MTWKGPFMQPITVAIADRDSAGRAVCERLLRHEQGVLVVAQTATSEDIVATVVRLKPRILVCSLNLCVDADCSLLLALRQECPATLVILLADDPVRDDRVMQALVSDVRGYLTHESVQQQLSKAVHGVDQGEAWLPCKLLGRILDRILR